MANWVSPQQPAGGTWAVLFSEVTSLLVVSAASLVVEMGAGLTVAVLGMLWPGLSWQKASSLLPDMFYHFMEAEEKSWGFLSFGQCTARRVPLNFCYI